MRRRKTPSIPVPETQAQAERLTAQIGRIDRAVEREREAVNARVTALRERSKAKIKALNTDAAGKFIALHSYVEAHRKELFPKGKKSVAWPAGVVGFRINPISVKFKTADTGAIIEALDAAGLVDAIRVTREIDKDAVLKLRAELPDDIPIRFEREEQFFLKPNDVIKAEHNVVIDRRAVTGDEK